MSLPSLILLLALAASVAKAQLLPEIANPPGKPTLDALKTAALEAERRLPAAAVEPRNYFEMTDAQRQRLSQWLPRTLVKLTRRERLHIVLLGDGMLGGAVAAGDADPLLASFPGVFAKLLCTQFYYTGGVRIARQDARKAPKERKIMGPEIVVQPVDVSSMVQAAAALTSEGFRGAPDLVIVALGFEDALSGTPLVDVEAGLRGVIGAAKAKKIDLLATGPMLQAAEPAETGLALTRGVASVIAEACAAEGVLFSDLGDLSRLIAPPPELAEGYRSFPILARQYQYRLIGGALNNASPAGTGLHHAMGEILFQDVMDGMPMVPWAVGKVRGSTLDGTRFQVTAEVRNNGAAPLRLTLLPLPTLFARPQEASPDVTLAAGGTQIVNITYSRTSTPDESKLRLPLLVISGSIARIHDLVTPVLPIGIVMKSRTTYNHEGIFNPGIEMLNEGETRFVGSWHLEFGGQKTAGNLDLSADAHETPDVKLDLAMTAGSPVRQTRPLTFQIETAGQKSDFSRRIEIIRNLGLKQEIALSAEDGRETGAKLQFDADGQKLFVTCDLNGIELIDDGESGIAYEATLHLDARRYGQRLTPGAIAGIRILGKAADGEATVQKPAVWAFGTGYAARFEAKEIKATLSSTPTGLRRLTIALPRTYLYDHEWALNNGNSQLGVNFTLRAAGRRLFLTSSSRHPEDAEALAVLELTDKPTLRATVRVE
jgi:hypothetical protein